MAAAVAQALVAAAAATHLRMVDAAAPVNARSAADQVPIEFAAAAAVISHICVAVVQHATYHPTTTTTGWMNSYAIHSLTH